jgi:hypothetical protein
VRALSLRRYRRSPTRPCFALRLRRATLPTRGTRRARRAAPHHSIVKQPARLSPDVRHRPLFISGSGFADLFVPSPPKGRAERQGVSPRPRRHVGEHVASCAFRAHDSVCRSTRRVAVYTATASDAAHTPAFRTRWFYRLATPSGTTSPGALTECWASPHCWVLGPPTSSAGHRPFTTSRVARLNRRAAHAKGPHTRQVRRIPRLRR